MPFGSYVLAASTEEAGVTFDIPAAYQTVSVAPGQNVDIGTIEAMSPNARGVDTGRETATDSTTTEGVHVTTYTGFVTVTWTESGADVPAGYADATYSIETNTGTDGAWEGAAGAALAGGDSTGLGRFEAGANDGEFMVRVVATAANDSDEDPQHDAPLVLNSEPATVEAVDPSVSGVEAARDTANADMITVGWRATTNDRSAQRVVVQFSDGTWYVAASGTPATIESGTRSWSLDASTLAADASWTSVDGQSTRQAQAELAKAFDVAVESVQGTADDDDNPWNRSTSVSVGAKPDGG